MIQVVNELPNRLPTKRIIVRNDIVNRIVKNNNWYRIVFRFIDGSSIEKMIYCKNNRTIESAIKYWIRTFIVPVRIARVFDCNNNEIEEVKYEL